MMRYRALGNTGLKVSIIGMGGSGFGNVYGKYDEEKAIHCVRQGIEMGINFIDTAYWYGQGLSESFLGKALSGIEREKYILATKVGRFEREYPKMFDFSREKVIRSVHDSLERLKVDFVDILHIHDVEFAPNIEVIVKETLPALQSLKEKGLCRFIGITGYPVSTLKQIVEQSKVQIDCVLSYCRLTLNDSSLIEDFSFFKSRNIGIINASAVGMGLLTNSEIQPWHPATADIRRACEKAVKYCEREGVDLPRLAVNYTTSFEEVASTLITMNDVDLMKRNMDAALTPLTEKELSVRDYIIHNFFTPLTTKHWEGVELAVYKSALESSS